jgi:hypothetical protein
VGLRDLFRRRRPAPLPCYVDDGSLELLVVAADPAVADSTVLADLQATTDHDPEQPVLVRHHLVRLPDEAAVERARELLAQDGYALTVLPGPPYDVRAWRTQRLTAMSAAQERSRMAGLAQRLGGDVAGWDALRPPATAPSVESGP